MKLWPQGITGKLFLAILTTCIVLPITMHWAVRISFERGFIDYIKHGNWHFLRNNDRTFFQLLRSIEHDDDGEHHPPMPPQGWRTQFWVVDVKGRVLVGPRYPIPEDGMRRPVVVENRTVGEVISSPVERLTRNTDINFDRQQRRTSWLIVVLAALLAAAATFPLARGLLTPVKRLVEGTHKLATGDFSTRVNAASHDELGSLA